MSGPIVAFESQIESDGLVDKIKTGSTAEDESQDTARRREC